jgi:potassium efflux system protein
MLKTLWLPVLSMFCMICPDRLFLQPDSSRKRAVALFFFCLLTLGLATTSARADTIAFELAQSETAQPDALSGETQKDNAETSSEVNPELPSNRSDPSPAQALAASLSQTTQSILDEGQKTLQEGQTVLDEVAARLQNPNLRDNALINMHDRLDLMEQQVTQALTALQEPLQNSLTRLQALTPAEGAPALPETDALQQERAGVEARIEQLEEVTRPLQLLQSRIEELGNALTERRRNLLTDRLLDRSRSLFDISLWQDAVEALPRLFTRLQTILSSWWGLISEKAGPALGVVIVLGIAGVVAMARPMRKRFLGFTRRNNDIAPTPLRQYLGALWIALSDVVVVSFGVSIIYLSLKVLDVMPLLVQDLLHVIIAGLLIFAITNGVLRAMLAPARSKWRLLALPDGPAEQIVTLSRLGLIFFAVGFVINGVLDILAASLALSVVNTMIMVLGTSLCLLLAVRQLSTGLPDNEETEGLQGRNGLWRLLIPALFITSLISIISTVLGYVGFGEFLVIQIIRILVILGFLHLLLNTVDIVLSNEGSQTGPFTHWMQSSFGMKRQSAAQFGALLTGIMQLLLIFFGAIMIFAPFGFETRNVLSAARQAVTGFQIGNISISFTAILGALALFAVVLVLVKALQRWLDKRYLPYTQMDDGLKSSIRTIIGYIGFIIAAVIAFSYVGLNLENVAIVAGALSVGIGFGLQSIVSNFVSGLILLAERPFQAGDWVVIGGEEGHVKKVSVRATEIETFDRSTVIVPNSDFISGTVKNWVHGTRFGRINIPIGVSYSSDPEQVRDLLLEVANDHPLILSDPEPRVIFNDFGASSLDFLLQAYLADISAALTTRSELRFAICRIFKENGVEIPFPQTDIHLRDMDRLEALFQRGSSASAK